MFVLFSCTRRSLLAPESDARVSENLFSVTQIIFTSKNNFFVMHRVGWCILLQSAPVARVSRQIYCHRQAKLLTQAGQIIDTVRQNY